MMHEIPNKRDEYSWYLKMRQYVDFDGDEWAEMAQNGFNWAAREGTFVYWSSKQEFDDDPRILYEPSV